jgi:hypothetical protein
MSVFVVISPNISNPKLEAAIIEHFSEEHYKISDNQWLICAGGISQSVAERLGIPSGDVDTAIVFAASGYWGRANPAIWEWLKVKWDKDCD